MLASHAAMYSRLNKEEIAYLWQRLIEKKMVTAKLPPEPDAYTLLSYLEPYSHTEVILSLANDPKEIAMDIASALLEKPIYQCARGETGEPMTDIYGRPLRFPLGHRRGEPPATLTEIPVDIQHMFSRRHLVRRDRRRILSVAPNPKGKNAKAYQRYEQYRVGETVYWHLKHTELTMADINYDAKKGFIKFEAPLPKRSTSTGENQ